MVQKETELHGKTYKGRMEAFEVVKRMVKDHVVRERVSILYSVNPIRIEILSKDGCHHV